MLLFACTWFLPQVDWAAEEACARWTALSLIRADHWPGNSLHHLLLHHHPHLYHPHLHYPHDHQPHHRHHRSGNPLRHHYHHLHHYHHPHDHQPHHHHHLPGNHLHPCRLWDDGEHPLLLVLLPGQEPRRVGEAGGGGGCHSGSDHHHHHHHHHYHHQVDAIVEACEGKIDQESIREMSFFNFWFSLLKILIFLQGDALPGGLHQGDVEAAASSFQNRSDLCQRLGRGRTLHPQRWVDLKSGWLRYFGQTF